MHETRQRVFPRYLSECHGNFGSRLVPFLSRESHASVIKRLSRHPCSRERDCCRLSLSLRSARVYRLFPECGMHVTADRNSGSRFGTHGVFPRNHVRFNARSHGTLTDKADRLSAADSATRRGMTRRSFSEMNREHRLICDCRLTQIRPMRDDNHASIHRAFHPPRYFPI